MKSLVPAAVLLTALATPAAAQNTAEKPKNEVAIEYTSPEASWYMVSGPRVSFKLDAGEAGKFSGAYVPLDDAKNGGYVSANDFHLLWQPPTKNVKLNLFFMNTAANGIGGTVIASKKAGPVELKGRAALFTNKVNLQEIRALSKYLDATAGIFHAKDGSLHPYGYLTANFGSHDDTITFGYSNKDTIWHNASFERERWGLLEIASYQDKTGNWTADLYFGIDDINRPWFSREIDRLIAFNDIAPKPRSVIPAFTSFLGFAKYAVELRADRTDDTTFLEAAAGRNFPIGKAKLGFGAGIEYVRDKNGVLYQPNGEVSLVTPIMGCDLTASYTARKKEGHLYVGLTKNF